MRHHGVDKDVIDGKIRVSARGLPADVEEHAVADLQDTGLMNDGEMLAPVHGKLAGRLCNSLAAVSRDAAERDHDLRRDQQFAVALFHVAVGVETFGILPHHDKVKRTEPVAQTGKGSSRPQVGKEVQILSKEFRRINLAAVLVLEISGSRRPEYQSVR